MSQPVQKKQVPGWKRSTVRYGFVIMALVWLAISATTSAAFFWQYLPNLLPFDMAGNVARYVSAIIGVVLFDVGGVLWLNVFLFSTETSEQRGIAATMAVVDLAGSVAATIAYLALNNNGLANLDYATENTIGIVSIVIVIGAISANFIAANLYQANSVESQTKTRDDNRRDRLAAVNDRLNDLLDERVDSGVEEHLLRMADDLVVEEANYYADLYARQRRAAYASDDAVARRRNEPPTGTPSRENVDEETPDFTNRQPAVNGKR